MADACIFCDIVAKKAPAHIVHEDEKVMAFHDAEPSAPLHILVIPKEHHPNLDSLSDDAVFVDLVTVAKQLGEAHSGDKGYRLGINSSKQADVEHIHLHVIGGIDKDKPAGRM